jgi:hypothetical protein
MDWDRDNAGLSEKDLENVFKYEKKSTTVVRMLVGEKVDSRDSQGCIPILTNSQKHMIWSLDGSDEWEEWLQNVRKGNLGNHDSLVDSLLSGTSTNRSRFIRSGTYVRTDPLGQGH